MKWVEKRFHFVHFEHLPKCLLVCNNKSAFWLLLYSFQSGIIFQIMVSCSVETTKRKNNTTVLASILLPLKVFIHAIHSPFNHNWQPVKALPIFILITQFTNENYFSLISTIGIYSEICLLFFLPSIELKFISDIEKKFKMENKIGTNSLPRRCKQAIHFHHSCKTWNILHFASIPTLIGEFFFERKRNAWSFRFYLHCLWLNGKITQKYVNICMK